MIVMEILLFKTLIYDCIINDSYIYFVNDGDNMQKAPKVRLDGGNIKSIDNGRNFIRK